MPFPTRYTRIPYTGDDKADIAIDRQRGYLWVLAGGGYNTHNPTFDYLPEPGPTFFKVRMSDGQIVLSGQGPFLAWDYEDTNYGQDQTANYEVWYIAVDEATGNLYVANYMRFTGPGDGKFTCLNPSTLETLFESPSLPLAYNRPGDPVIVGAYLYYVSGTRGSNPQLGLHVSRMPLTLAQVDWSATVYAGIDTFETPDGPVAIDSAGNAWYGCLKILGKVAPDGSVTSYNLAASLNADACIKAVAYDSGTNTLGLFVNLRSSNGTGAFVAPYFQIVKVNCATGAVVATFSAPTDLRFQSPPLTHSFDQVYDGRVLLQLDRSTFNTPENRGALVDFDLRAMAIVRIYSLSLDWQLDPTWVDTDFQESPLNTAERLQDVIPDFVGSAIYGYNAWQGYIYPDSEHPKGSFGLWQFSLTAYSLPACPEPPAYLHDVALDTFISYDCKIAVKFQTYITRMREGHEERIGEWQDPIWVFDITPALRDQADLDYLLAFFRARHGPQYIFKFLNPLDNQVTNEVFAVGDGVATVFQLSRRYQTGIAGDDYYYVRPIFLPMPGALVYDNGVLVEQGHYVVCPLGGSVIFVTPPAAGHQLTWSGSYYTPVRFMNNSVYSIVEHYEQFEDKVVLVEERLSIQGAILPESESPDFLDVLFPYRYAQRASMGPEIDVITVQSDSGVTFRTAQFKSAKIRFTVEETEQPLAIIQQILAFFLNRKGRLISFRARDITDFQLTGEPLQEAADGTRTQFQVVKRYASGGQTDVRTIQKPNSDLVVYGNAVALVPQPSVDTATGTVTFTTPPAAGVQLTVSGTFDVPVRFDSDVMTFSIKGYEWFNMEAINLTETELGLPDFTMDTPTPPPLRAGAAPRLPAQQLLCDLPPRPAVTQYLEFRGAAGTGLQVEQPGGFYRRLAGASSLTFAVLLSHVKTGTPSGAIGAPYAMALLAHVMPGLGTDPALSPAAGFTVYVNDLGAGIALNAALGAYRYTTAGTLCVPELDRTPTVLVQGAQAASSIVDNEHMHAYVITMDWLSRQCYWSGTVWGSQSFPPEAFAYSMCIPGAGGVDARLLEMAASTYVGVRDPDIGSGEVGNDGWLGVVSAAPHTPALHSPLAARMYEHFLLPTFGFVDRRSMLRDVHTPLLHYWGSKYGRGFANVQSPALPTFDIFWWRADENVTVADASSGAIASWAPVACGFAWLKPDAGVLQDDGQPRQQTITTVPIFDDVLMLADGRRLLPRQI